MGSHTLAKSSKPVVVVSAKKAAPGVKKSPAMPPSKTAPKKTIPALRSVSSNVAKPPRVPLKKTNPPLQSSALTKKKPATSSSVKKPLPRPASADTGSAPSKLGPTTKKRAPKNSTYVSASKDFVSKVYASDDNWLNKSVQRPVQSAGQWGASYFDAAGKTVTGVGKGISSMINSYTLNAKGSVAQVGNVILDRVGATGVARAQTASNPLGLSAC